MFIMNVAYGVSGKLKNMFSNTCSVTVHACEFYDIVPISN